MIPKETKLGDQDFTATQTAWGRLAALVTCATFFSFRFPFPALFQPRRRDYLQRGLIGGGSSRLCGSVGAALADLLLGYPLGLLTFVIKGRGQDTSWAPGSQKRKKALAAGAFDMITGYTPWSRLYGPAAAPVECNDIIQTE